MEGKKKIIIAVVCIIVASVAIGFIYDAVMNRAEAKDYPREYPKDYLLDHPNCLPLSEHVEKWAKEYGVPEYIVYSVIKAESDFDPDTVSSADAVGLMQIRAAESSNTFEYIAGMVGDKYDPSLHFDPNTNIKYGTYYLSYLYSKFDNWSTVFAAYNGGEGNVSKWLKDPTCSLDGKTLYRIPFTETKVYVKKVNDYCKAYRRLYY